MNHDQQAKRLREIDDLLLRYEGWEYVRVSYAQLRALRDAIAPVPPAPVWTEQSVSAVHSEAEHLLGEFRSKPQAPDTDEPPAAVAVDYTAATSALAAVASGGYWLDGRVIRKGTEYVAELISPETPLLRELLAGKTAAVAAPMSSADHDAIEVTWDGNGTPVYYVNRGTHFEVADPQPVPPAAVAVPDALKNGIAALQWLLAISHPEEQPNARVSTLLDKCQQNGLSVRKNLEAMLAAAQAQEGKP